MSAQEFRPRALCLDIETSASNALELRKLAAWRPDTERRAVFQGRFEPARLAEELDALADGAAFVVGHNIRRHDLPVLERLFPTLRLHALGVVDTLELSPIAFPQNPYHSLVKDYRLVRDARSDPLKDAQLALRLWHDQFNAFRELGERSPAELACHHFLLAGQVRTGVGSFFARIRGALAPTAEQVRRHAIDITRGKACSTHLDRVLDEALPDPAQHLPLAYVLAWMRVSGGNSVLPSWVRLQFPATRTLIRRLRETPCGEPACSYCSRHLNPHDELTRYFGFETFRPEPASAAGGSLQEEIVRAVYAGRPVLGILPTGGGKSICFQLPALSRHWRNGSLTVVVSPLQSLMKDQVDNLVRQGIYTGATLNGLLTMPERRDVLERVRLGDVGLLFVSPEQFRNRAFVEAIRYREIGAWVFDEAHCLSKWGHDFRPDYLYVPRFIRERYSEGAASLCGFTATAKREVIEDLRAHFRDSLGVELEVIDGGHDRPNLHYEVLAVARAEKLASVHRLLEKEIGGGEGGAIVFVSRRARAEETAAFLEDMGWACAAFHAGLDAAIKREVQIGFIRGELRVIVATNAFGMGVDKPDVRLVIHADIPGSLENYLQEAGRAGRDRADARCVLLFDEEDVDEQFGLTTRSRLSRQDIAGILRALRRHAARTGTTEVVVTPGELLADDELSISIDAQQPDADTRVRTAVAWLERARFLQRDENHTRVFPGSLKVASLAAAAARLEKADLSREVLPKYLDLVGLLINSGEDEGISTDELMVRLGATSEECIRMLHQLEQLGVLSNDLALTVMLRKGVSDSSAERLQRLARAEAALLDLLPELAPDADASEWQDMNLRALCEALRSRTDTEVLPDTLLALMRSAARPFGDDRGGHKAMFEVRVVRRELLRVRLLRNWSNIREVAERRRAVAAVLLRDMLGRLPDASRGIDLRLECKLGELAAALRTDMTVGPQLRDEMAAIEAGLLYLHDNQVLIIDRGRTVFRSAMTIRVYPEEKGRRFTRSDFEPLRQHYAEKVFQVHVMHEYARLGLKKLSDALAFVLAYFSLPKLDFVRRYFATRRETLERASTEESWRRIVAELRHPVQERLVSEKPEQNVLILAGPGSGKTRVVVHRVAYLVRVLREPPESVLVLAFNRSAAWEIHRRLRGLVGAEASGVTVLTYHALALRLTGRSLAGAAARGEDIDFEGLIDEATALLQGASSVDPTIPRDELRERLLAGYRHILVDEYQDIDARQYALISAIAGRTSADADGRLTILAVGDDDQNIYAWRHTSNAFIRRFEADYDARVEYLVENYRSSAHIIDAANAVIAPVAERMKREQPIRINHARRRDAGGGRWQALDPLTEGRVQIVAVPPDPIGQAAVVMRELERRLRLDAAADYSDFAILARNHATLEPIRAACECAGIRYCAPDREQSGQPRLHQVREGRMLLDLLQEKPQRRVSAAAVARWVGLRFPDPEGINPWAGLLAQFAEELQAAWPDFAVPASLVREALYEFGTEARRGERGRIVLSTLHGAKGREFKHVVMLDGGDWSAAVDDERRLFYVGMTRAAETLALCESVVDPNPFSAGLGGAPFLVRTPLPQPLATLPEYGWRYVSPGLRDIDLGFAGRQAPSSATQAALAELATGDALSVESARILTSRGVPVGRLAQGCRLPDGKVIRASVSALVWRSLEQTPPEYREALRSKGWWVVLPSLVIDVDSAAPQRGAGSRQRSSERKTRITY